MANGVSNKISAWLKPRLRLYSIYCELGYIPWRKPRKEKSGKRVEKDNGSVYMGTKEALIPFLNDDAKRTFTHLLFRPGYMMRDYIKRGQHERYLAPLTALLVFYSVFSLLLAILNPAAARDPGYTLRSDKDDLVIESDNDSLDQRSETIIRSLASISRDVIVLPRLDLHPEEVDTPWKESLAALEGNLRGKGIPLFLGGFLLLWFSMSVLLRKYDISFSGAAAASAFVMCQSCLFLLLALLISFGRSTRLGLLFSALLLFIDYRQFLQIGNKKALELTVKTGIWIAVFWFLFFLILSGIVILIAYLR